MWKPIDDHNEAAGSGDHQLSLPGGWLPGGNAAAEPSEPAAPVEPAAQPLSPRMGSIATIEKMGDIAVATLTVTELTQELGASALADLLDELAETGALHYILDVNVVQYMDSACLGCLVEALNRLATHGGRIAIANSNHSVHYIFRLTRLDRVFTICADVMSAIQSIDRLRDAA